MKEKIRQFYDKAEKYGGWQQVPAARIYAIFEEFVDPARMGFSVAKAGLLACPVDSDITHLIKLQALKGASYGLCFGLSLSYLPYPYSPKLKWHRTAKSVNLDLCEQPQTDWSDADGGVGAGQSYMASALLGEKCFREEFDRTWKAVRPRILAWFEATGTLTGVLSKCADHLARKHTGVRRLPGARLVNAFTLARTGKAKEARAELEKFLGEYEEGEQARTNLAQALEQISLKKK
jgi:hypothetical protein